MTFVPFDPSVRRLRAMIGAAGVARDITYAHAGATRPARAFIRALENVTGRMALVRRSAGYEAETAQSRDLCAVLVERFGLRLDLVAGELSMIPTTGPLVIVANHPFGILDGLVMGHLLSITRSGDFRIMAHEVFVRAPALERIVLPIDFRETRAATERNLGTRKSAIRYLQGGGAVGIFPGGTVSTAPGPFGQAMDPLWRTFTARMIQKSGATVVPVWFDGSNSRLFQVASHLNQTLRMALLVREFRRRLDRPVRIAIGTPIPPEEIAARGGCGNQIMDFLRRRTYGLATGALDPGLLGHEFGRLHRREGQAHGGWRVRFGSGRADGAGGTTAPDAGRRLRLLW